MICLITKIDFSIVFYPTLIKSRCIIGDKRLVL